MRKSELQELRPPVTTKEKLLSAVIAWAFGLIAFVAYFGVWPRTPLGWILFLFLAPLLYIAAEALGERFASGIPIVRRMTDSVERATHETRFSWLRISYYLVGGIFLCIVIFSVMLTSDRLLGAQLEPIKQFWKHHFINWW